MYIKTRQFIFQKNDKKPHEFLQNREQTVEKYNKYLHISYIETLSRSHLVNFYNRIKPYKSKISANSSPFTDAKNPNKIKNGALKIYRVNFNVEHTVHN